MSKVLFVDSCIKNEEESRTHMLCVSFIVAYKRFHPNDELDTIVLKKMQLKPLLENKILYRNNLIKNSDYDNIEFFNAAEFKEYDKIIIGAPMYNMSIPALLKTYIEDICVMGLTFNYNELGQCGLCKANKLMYITTRGDDFSKEPLLGTEIDIPYMSAITKMLGINEFNYYAFNNTDKLDVETLNNKLNKASQELTKIAGEW
ncbi:MAG: NAD(P)H-dependent oxidoreductase [Erysipelotrichaceae bacterium]